jgi:hypothetical protein
MASVVGQAFPYGVEFQSKLIKVLMLDDAGDLVMEHIKPVYFESAELRWIYAEIQTYWKAYRANPTWMVLKHRAQTAADPNMRPTIQQMLSYQETLPVPDEAYIRGEILNWIKTNIFHAGFKEAKALWDAGKRMESIDHQGRVVDQIRDMTWKKEDAGWFFEELPQREHSRIQASMHEASIVTGINELDKILDGGLSPTEMGIWIAYAKGGKSTMLMNHGAMAIRAMHKKVLHFVFEGSRKQVENRYEAWFMDEYYSVVKKGGVSPAKYKQTFAEYQFLTRKLRTVGMTDKWNYSILDIEQAIANLRKTYGWIPELIVIDYGDLVHGRNGPYPSQWEDQMDAYRDMKAIANRGFAVWTAAQAQRPDTKTWDTKEHLITSMKSTGGSIEKVRVGDFIGSLNATKEEQAQGRARIYAEFYRDNEAGKVIEIMTDIAKMKMGVGIQGPPNPSIGGGPKSPNLGYKNGHHGHGGVGP